MQLQKGGRRVEQVRQRERLRSRKTGGELGKLHAGFARVRVETRRLEKSGKFIKFLGKFIKIYEIKKKILLSFRPIFLSLQNLPPGTGPNRMIIADDHN